MNLRGAAKGLDQAFYYILFGILVLNSLMYLFLFILNWEAWFFGMKLDGRDAGILLFIYFMFPAILAYLLFRYPRKIAIIALLSIFYFGFKYLDSSTTVQLLSDGRNSFTGFMAVMVVIPLVVLIGHFIAGKFYDREEFFRDGGQVKRSLLGSLRKLESGDYLSGDLLALTVAAFVIVLLFGMLVMIPVLILLAVFIAITVTKKKGGSEESDEKSRLNITVIRLLLTVTILMALLLLILFVIPVFFIILTR